MLIWYSWPVYAAHVYGNITLYNINTLNNFTLIKNKKTGKLIFRTYVTGAVYVPKEVYHLGVTSVVYLGSSAYLPPVFSLCPQIKCLIFQRHWSNEDLLGVSVWLLSEVVGRMGCWLMISWWMTDMKVPSMTFIITNSFCVSDRLLTSFYFFPPGKVPEKLLQKPSGLRQMHFLSCKYPVPFRKWLTFPCTCSLSQEKSQPRSTVAFPAWIWDSPTCLCRFTLARLFIESCSGEGSVVAEVEDAVIHLGEEHGWRNNTSGLHSRRWQPLTWD